MFTVIRPLSALLVGVILAAAPLPAAHAGKGRKASKAKKTGRAAPKKPDAGALFDDAVMRRGLADFEGSQVRLEETLGATKDPKKLALVRLYMGANLLDMGKAAEARAAMLAALGHHPILKVPADMKTAVRDLLHEVRAGASGTLEVSSNLAARVAVDGKPVGQTPYEAAVPIGLRRVQVQAPGGDSEERAVMIYPGRAAAVRLMLNPPSSSGAGEGERERGGGRRIWTWVAGAAGLAAAGAGIGVWLWAGSDYSAWEEVDATPASAARDERLDELEGGIRSKEYAAYALWGTAGLLGAAAVVLFFVEGGAEEKQPAASAWQRLTLTPVAGQAAGLMLRGSF